MHDGSTMLPCANPDVSILRFEQAAHLLAMQRVRVIDACRNGDVVAAAGATKCEPRNRADPEVTAAGNQQTV